MQITRCTKCMGELKDGVRVCPRCGFEQDSIAQPGIALKRNTILHGRYLIGNVIGQGGFGITYVGWDLTLEMKVAVKEYFPSGAASRTNSISNQIQWESINQGSEERSEGLERFLKEARRMARLDEVPSIVRVRDAFGENGTAYIVMDFVEGVTLKTYLLGHGVLRYEECMKLLSPILDSLAVIHDNGFIHRDISPDNIMLRPDGSARLLDMGAAVDVTANEGHASMAVVKRNFSAPEQYMESESLGSWTDVYAMGATIYYCMTGKVVPEALEREFKKTPLYFDPALNIPAHVIGALSGALELHAEKRIRDMREFKERLMEEEGTLPPKPQEESQPEFQEIPPTLPFQGNGDEMKTVPYTGNVEQEKKAEAPIRFHWTEEGEKEKKAPAQEKKTSVEEPKTPVSGIFHWPEEEKIESRRNREREMKGEHKIQKAFPRLKETESVQQQEQSKEPGTVKSGAKLPVNSKRIGKKWFGIAIAVAVLLAAAFSIAYLKMDRTYKTEDWTYKKMDNGGICLVEYIGERTELLELPSEIEGQPVLRLGEEGGQGCSLAFSPVREIVLPDQLEEIEDFAFSLAMQLETIILPKSLVTIEKGAFVDCANLKQLELPEGLKTIGVAAFSGCSGLNQLELPEGLETIERSAFRDTGIKKITIPATVNKLGCATGILDMEQVNFEGGKYKIIDGVIYNKDGNELIDFSCSISGTFVIPSEIDMINEWTFSGNSLEEVEIPGSVKIIKEGTFAGATKLRKIVIGDGVELLGWSSFAECKALTEIVIPKSVKEIGEEAFCDCPALSKVTIPESVKVIGKGAFKDSPNLKSVTISRDCQVGEEAFGPDVEIKYYD